MDQTAVFILFTLIGTLISFAIIAGSRSAETAQKQALGFYFLCLFLSMSMTAATIFSVSGVFAVKGTFALVFRILIFRAWLVIGTGISTAVLIALISSGFSGAPRLKGEAVRSFISSRYVLKGLCLSVSVAFLMTEIGKLAHDAEMRQFFLDSGYAVWFLYFVMISETLGSIGLFITKLIIPAASGLAILMLGAIYTHYHNGDPFSDSLEAAHLLILLLCIIVIKLRSQKISTGDAENPVNFPA